MNFDRYDLASLLVAVELKTSKKRSCVTGQLGHCVDYKSRLPFLQAYCGSFG